MYVYNKAMDPSLTKPNQALKQLNTVNIKNNKIIWNGLTNIVNKISYFAAINWTLSTKVRIILQILAIWTPIYVLLVDSMVIKDFNF